MLSKKIKNQLYVFTMFIDKIKNNVMKINNNEFIQIETQKHIYDDLKNS